jgi:FkbM family methyltransferase
MKPLPPAVPRVTEILLRPWRVLRRLLEKPQVVVLNGVRLLVEEGTSEEIRRLIYRERYERGEARCLLACLEAQDVVLEVGAGRGYLTTLAAQRVGSERVFAYEANPALLPLIEATFAANGVRPQLTHAVLGDGAGAVTFFVEDHYLSSSRQQRSAGARAVEVPQLDAATELARVRPTVVIMDIEGGEASLVPLFDWRSVEKLVLEIHPALLGPAGTRAVLDHLTGQGFVEVKRLSSTRKKLFLRARP